MSNKLHKAISPSSYEIATCNDRLFSLVGMDLAERLRAARARRFAEAIDAARFLGVPQATYAHHEAGTRNPKPDAVERYARAFGVTPEWLQFGRGQMAPSGGDAAIPPISGAELRGPVAQPVRTLMIVGEVAAGVWREANADGFEPVPYEAPADPRFPKDAQCLFRVIGTSINRKATSGSLVRCVSVYAVADRLNGREPQDGDWVVARRTKNGFAEMTVKQLRSRNGELMLFPDSTDLAHQDPIRVGRHDGDEVEIVAFVLDFINPATRF
jgi:SOS-response transcriptional repressor LexA